MNTKVTIRSILCSSQKQFSITVYFIKSYNIRLGSKVKNMLKT